MAPTIAENKDTKISILGSKNIDKTTKGEIFCQVSKIKELIQFNPSITSGNQKCIGDIPNFVVKAKVTIKLKLLEIKLFPYIKKIRKLKTKTEEAIAWTKKYLMAASLLLLLYSKFITNGIKDIKFNSNPIHIPNNEEEEIVIKVPKTRKKK